MDSSGDRGTINWRVDRWDFGHMVGLAAEVVAADSRIVIRHAVATKGHVTWL